MLKKTVQLYAGSAAAGTVTEAISPGANFVLGHFSFIGTAGLAVEVQGALGVDARTYVPTEDEWRLIGQGGTAGLLTLPTIPTLIRFRVTSGTLTRVMAMLYTEGIGNVKITNVVG